MPEKLITYTQKFTVYRTDGDHLGHVKLGALLRYAQQVATAHAEAVGLDDALYRKTHTAYVLAKLALHVTRLPRVDEELTLVTQPERCKRAVNKRITHFYDADGAEVATMDSRWVLIDTEKRMILRKHPEQFDDQWAEDVPLELPMRLPRVAPEDCETLGTQAAAYSRCDMNGHLNNTRYADAAADVLPLEVLTRGAVTPADHTVEAMQKQLLAAGINGKLVPQKGGVLNINVLSTMGISEAAAESEARAFLPAHLSLVFDFGKNTWDAQDAVGSSWNVLDLRNKTWNALDVL